MRTCKLGNPHRKARKRPRMGAFAPQPLKRLSLHESDPITGSEDTLYGLSYEEYRGYTIYGTPDGRCCIHGRGGCLKLWGLFVCLQGIEEAKTLIKRFRAEGYSYLDGAERYLPTWQFVWMNRGELQQETTASHSMQCVS